MAEPTTSACGGRRLQGFFKAGSKGEPLVTIITVVYNAAIDLEITIKSIQTQSYENIEHVIIDGGSTDGTLDVIRRYNEVIDYWKSERDDGLYDAMNKGIEEVRGEYVMFINAGDKLLYLDPHTLRGGSSGYFFDEARNLLRRKPLTKLFLCRNTACHQAIIYAAGDVPCYRLENGFMADFEQTTRLSIPLAIPRFNRSIVFFKKPGLSYRSQVRLIIDFINERWRMVKIVHRNLGVVLSIVAYVHMLRIIVIKFLFRQMKLSGSTEKKLV